MIEKLPYVAGGALCASFLMPLMTHDATPIRSMETQPMHVEQITSPETVLALFPRTPAQITEQAETTIRAATLAMQKLLAIPADQRTFANTVQALDELGGFFGIRGQVLSILEMLSPEKEIRDRANEEIKHLEACQIDLFKQKALYEAIDSYNKIGRAREQLSTEQAYYLEETLNELKRAGLCLHEEQLAQVRTLNKQLADLSVDFSTAIAQDNRTITIAPDALDGVSQITKEQLERDAQGNYLVTMSYPVYFDVMDNCHSAETRRTVSALFNNRGYPDNDARLRQIIALRDQLAHLLGYENYAALNIDDTMAEKPERVHAFLTAIATKATSKAMQEVDTFLAHVPSVTKDPVTGKLAAHDTRYLLNQYRKTALAVDNQKIAEYFPVDRALDGMLAVYQQLLSLRFTRSKPNWSWHPDVELITIYDATSNELRGYLLLDLYPRENKYGHACCSKIIPARKVILADGSVTITPSVTVVVANFPTPTADKPALFKFDDVNTFFHEFGHAMHCLLGATEMDGCSGYNTKFDFVEVPSQMFEEWLYEPEVLALVSGHYQTGEPLPETLIAKLREVKKMDAGLFMSRQCWLSFYALELFNRGATVDPQALMHELAAVYMPYMQPAPDSHFYASFGHLTGYGARYYGYLWSRVYALDLFAAIKARGLLDPVVGKQLTDKVLGKGGSCPPDKMLQDFLGRTPTQEAFLNAYGIR